MKEIQINYQAAVKLDIIDVERELGISRDDIIEIKVSYNIVTITTNDDVEHVYEFDSILFGEDINTKTPDSIMLNTETSYSIAMGDKILIRK